METNFVYHRSSGEHFGHRNQFHNVVFGADKVAEENILVGGYFGYSNSNVNGFNNVKGQGDHLFGGVYDSYQAAIKSAERPWD